MENNRKNSQADTEKYNLEILLRKPSLRASIPRRVSQVCRETIITPDTICGLGCIRGQWLQTFANRTSFIFVYEVLGCFYACYVAYFYGSITTLEKRFKFSNLYTGILAASGDFSKIISCLVFSLFPLNVHKPRCLGLAVFLIILSAAIFTTPHFFYGTGYELNEWNGNATEYEDGYCIESCARCNKEPNKNSVFFLFLSTQILHGIGGGLYLTQGKSYKDDNIHMYQSPALISLLSILKTIGPAFGYWLSSVCLKTHELLGKTTYDNETHWVGAWWLGNLLIAFILCVVGFLLVLFPRTLPKAAVRRIFNIERGEELKNNFTSRAFNTIHLFGTFNAWGFLVYFVFLPKYVQIQYRISVSTANLTAGSVTLISAAFGIVMASSVITRYRPKARTLVGWTITVGILSISSLTFYTYLGCTENDAEIKAVAFQYSKMGKSLDCGFYPICVKSETVIPDCNLKCDALLHNGTKVHKNHNHTLNSNNKELIKDLCPIDCYSNFLLFIMVTCFMTFINATGETSNFWFGIKCSNNFYKLHSTKLHFFNILALVPAPIIFGYILDKSCLLWGDNLTDAGNCWLYDNESLRHIMNITAIIFVIIGIIFNMGVWYSVKNLTLFQNNEEGTQQNDDS